MPCLLVWNAIQIMFNARVSMQYTKPKIMEEFMKISASSYFLICTLLVIGALNIKDFDLIWKCFVRGSKDFVFHPNPSLSIRRHDKNVHKEKLLAFEVLSTVNLENGSLPPYVLF